MEFTFGSDPEFMISRWEDLHSAIGVLPKKEHAISRAGSKFYYDNVLAEIAVKPAKTKEEMLHNTRQSLQQLAKLVKPYRFNIRASAKYPNKQLTDREAKIAGCNPEWNVYSLKCVLPPEEIISSTPFRSAGGHIHIGHPSFEDPLVSFDMIRMMDLFVGIPSIYMDTDITSKDRRKIYGHAGSHRPCDYGFEYRVLGNFWFSSPAHASIIYDLTQFVADFVEQQNHKKFWSVDEAKLNSENPSKAYTCSGYDQKLLCKSINNCDKKQAEKFMIFISNYLNHDLWQKVEALANTALPDPYEAWELV